jgi:hypothetical protein
MRPHDKGILMSLNRRQTQQTRDELAANLILSGLAPDTVGHSLGFTPERLDHTVRVTRDADASDVWLLRDFLDQVIRDRGLTPRPWTVLIDGGHDTARRWFTIRPVPATPAQVARKED